MVLHHNTKTGKILCHHKDDFGIKAEWHFSATSHGKGACDGLGGTVKRLAARASLQRPYNDQLMTPRQLFDWACKIIPAAYFGYCTSEDYAREQSSLERRFQLSHTIPAWYKKTAFFCTYLKQHSRSQTLLSFRYFPGKRESL